MGGTRLAKGGGGWFEPEPQKTLALRADGPFGALLFAGEPIREPAVAYGPFVMSTKEEIVQAFEDYHAGRLVA